MIFSMLSVLLLPTLISYVLCTSYVFVTMISSFLGLLHQPFDSLLFPATRAVPFPPIAMKLKGRLILLRLGPLGERG